MPTLKASTGLDPAEACFIGADSFVIRSAASHNFAVSFFATGGAVVASVERESALVGELAVEFFGRLFRDDSVGNYRLR